MGNAITTLCIENHTQWSALVSVTVKDSSNINKPVCCVVDSEGTQEIDVPRGIVVGSVEATMTVAYHHGPMLRLSFGVVDHATTDEIVLLPDHVLYNGGKRGEVVLQAPSSDDTEEHEAKSFVQVWENQRRKLKRVDVVSSNSFAGFGANSDGGRVGGGGREGREGEGVAAAAAATAATAPAAAAATAAAAAAVGFAQFARPGGIAMDSGVGGSMASSSSSAGVANSSSSSGGVANSSSSGVASRTSSNGSNSMYASFASTPTATRTASSASTSKHAYATPTFSTAAAGIDRGGGDGAQWEDLGYSADYLAAEYLDPGAWSMDGVFMPPDGAIGSILPKAGWHWASEWELDVKHSAQDAVSVTDSEGWQYAQGFGAVFSGVPRSDCSVRRRRWLRWQVGPKLRDLQVRSVCVLPAPVMEAMAQRFCPLFWLDKDEEYYPSSFTDYLPHCELWYQHDRVLCEGQVTLQTLLGQHGPPGAEAPSHGQFHPDGRIIPNENWHLKCNPKAHYGCGSRDDGAGDVRVPVYAHITDDEVLNEPVFAISYVMFFPYNGACLVPIDEKGHVNSLQGGHEADVEHVRIHVSKTTNLVHSVFFSAHRERDGCLKLVNAVEMREGRVVVYVARNGHGAYPSPGVKHRLFFMANDHCSAGRRWDPGSVVLLPDARTPGLEKTPLAWLLYCGSWGSCFESFGHCSEKERALQAKGGVVCRTGSSPHGPACKDWWVTEKCGNRHWFKTLFLPNAD